MNTVNIKPLSANVAYKPAKHWKTGRLIIVSTKEHKRYINDVCVQLNHIGKPAKRIFAYYEFGVSSPLFDTDNGVKPFQDCLQKKYSFNDRDVIGHLAVKNIVPKGQEYIKWVLKEMMPVEQILTAIGVE